MAEVASAYVSLLPSFRGGGAAIAKELGGPLDQAGKEGGERYGTGMKAGIAGMATRIFKPLAAAAGVASVGAFVKSAIDEASGLGESINALNVSYGEASVGVQELGKQAATSLGLSNLEFNNLAVRFSGFSKTIAGEGGDVVGTLDDLTTRASDFASVMNLDVSEAAELFQSGLAGETEPLRKFGIDLSAAAVEAYGLANGMAANGKSLTEAEKVQARYGLLMESTSQTQGDFANTSDQLANQQRILAAEFADVRARIGAALLPAMTSLVGFASGTLLPALDGLGSFLTGTLIPGFQSFAQWVSANAVPIGVVAGVITAVFLPALIALGVQATISAAKQVAAWVVTQAAAISGAAAQSLAVTRTVAGWVLMGAQSLIQAARMAAAWLIALGPIGLVIAAVVGIVALIIANWDTVVAWTQAAWTAVTEWLATAWQNITSGVTSAWNGILAFFRAIPGRVVSFFMNWTLLGLLIQHWDSIKSGAESMWNGLVDFIRGIPGRIVNALGNVGRMLYDSGKAIIQGLIDGIANMAGRVSDAVGDVLSAARDLLPFSPAKVGPFSGKGWTLYSGRSIVEALADGIADERGTLVSATERTMAAARAGLGGGLSAAMRADVGAVGFDNVNPGASQENHFYGLEATQAAELAAAKMRVAMYG